MNPPARQTPAPLVVALSLAAVQGLLLVGYAVLELANTASTRLAVGLTTSAFFAMYGVGLLACAWALHRGRSWARSPVVLTQLIAFGIAWSFRGEGTTGVAAALFAVGVVVLVGVLHPRSIEHLAEDDA